MGAAPLHAGQRPTRAPITPEALFAANTGWGLEPSVFRARFHREVMARDSDVILARKLAQTNGGWEPVDPWAKRKLVWVGDVTGRAMPLTTLRDINLFEQVQGRHRAFYLNALRDFAENHPSRKFFRYVVITSGRRLVAGTDDMKARKRVMMKKISAWQRHIRDEWDIEALVNIAEHTFDKDERSLHLHFNLMIWPHRALQGQRTKPIRDVKTGKTVGYASNAWEDFLQYSRQFLGVYWKECGEIRKLEELIKYCYKGEKRDPENPEKRISSDFRQDITPAEANWLFNQTFRARTITAYGGFKRHIKQLREDRQKLAYAADDDGTKYLRRVQLAPLPEKAEEGGIAETEEDRRGGVKRFENLVRGRTAPMAKASAWAEPGTLIENYTLNPCTPAGQKALDKRADIAEASRRIWDARGAPDPATALAVSDAWLFAGSDTEAAGIAAFPRRAAPPARSAPERSPEENGTFDPAMNWLEATAYNQAMKLYHGLADYQSAEAAVMLAAFDAGIWDEAAVARRFGALLIEVERLAGTLPPKKNFLRGKGRIVTPSKHINSLDCDHLAGADSIVHTTDLTLPEKMAFDVHPPDIPRGGAPPAADGPHSAASNCILPPDLGINSTSRKLAQTAGADGCMIIFDAETGEILN